MGSSLGSQRSTNTQMIPTTQSITGLKQKRKKQPYQRKKHSSARRPPTPPSKKKFQGDKENYQPISNFEPTRGHTKTQSQDTLSRYLEFRSQKAKEKVCQLREERIKREEMELTLKPKINQKSRKLAERLQHVSHERLYRKVLEKDNASFMENKRLQQEESNETFAPNINSKSKKMHRTVDHLYQWQMTKQRKQSLENEKTIEKLTAPIPKKRRSSPRKSQSVVTSTEKQTPPLRNIRVINPRKLKNQVDVLQPVAFEYTKELTLGQIE